MSSFRLVLLLLLAGNAVADGDGFIIGGGIESDSEDGVSASLIGGVGLGDKTWLSAGVARSSVELTRLGEVESLYADIELDHDFDPVGVRVGAAYWGDSDILESNDLRASVYWRGQAVRLAAEYEYRDFDFIIPSLDLQTSREIMFDADGFGASARFQMSENTSLRLAAIKYDYSVPFRPVENTDAANLLTVSRLSLLNTLVDHRARVTLGIDQGLKRWEIDVATWEGVIDRSRTKSATLRFLLPMGDKTDVEFGLGYDDSELYGDVMFFSLYLYFYGGD
ncbi:MAG: hypothetical protein OEM51_06020 [Gammaproteobacteria bacterium]|nr:hypothetical protein [Gammaproteobacteria bacterium]MDH3430087.1 hypothetical protein [Gammaproteobacteria bacterium]